MKARQACEGMIAEWPKYWQPYLILAKIALHFDEYKEVSDYIEQAKNNAAPELSLTLLREKVARKTGDLQAQIFQLDILSSLQPDFPGWARRLFSVYLSAQQYEAALASLPRLLSLAPETQISPNYLRLLRKNIASPTFMEAISNLISTGVDKWSLRMARAVCYAQAGNITAMWQDLEVACKINPDRPFTTEVNQALNAQIGNGKWRQESFEKLYTDNPQCAALLWHKAIMLDRNGEFERFRALVRENWHWAATKTAPVKAVLYMQNSLNAPLADDQMKGRTRYKSLLMANRLHEARNYATTDDEVDFIDQILSLPAPAFPLMSIADYSIETTIVGLERPNGVVLGFCGMADKLGAPAHVMDHLFAQLGLSVVYLRDFSRLLFLGGIKKLGPTLEDTLQSLSNTIESLGPGKPIFTFGNSGGGLGAMIYGEALGAVSSLVFSTPATINPKHHKNMGENRARLIVQRIMDNLDYEVLDLRAILERASETYRVTAYAGEGNSFDKAHADLLATMPKTKVHLLKNTAHHNSMMRAASQFGMLNIMKDSFHL